METPSFSFPGGCMETIKIGNSKLYDFEVVEVVK
jgi:hypothetical protein